MLSVALCSYNGAKFIEEQIWSILHQTRLVDEIVVCDDGSTDDTLQIIEKIQKECAVDIRIYQNERRLGPALNFQKAIELCKGDIIFLSDQDDVWIPEKVASIVDYFEHHPSITTVFTNANLIDTNGHFIDGLLWDYCFGRRTKALFDAGLEFECFAYANHATGATMAIRKQKIPIIKYNKEFLHDHALAILAANTDSLGYIDRCLIKYRIHSNQTNGIIMVPSTTDWRDLTDVMQEVKELPLCDNKQQRIAFNTIRLITRKHILGPLEIVLMHKQYKTLYHRAYQIMMWLDIQESFQHKKNYLLKKIHK